MTEEVNVCCPLFLTPPCADTSDHKHLVCDAQHGTLISNELAREYCVQGEDTFKTCPYYQRHIAGGEQW